MEYEQKINRYVIATLDEQTRYLKSLHFGKYEFVDNLIECTKTKSRKLAQDMVGYYYQDTHDGIDLVVIPLDITYALIDETE